MIAWILQRIFRIGLYAALLVSGAFIFRMFSEFITSYIGFSLISYLVPQAGVVDLSFFIHLFFSVFSYFFDHSIFIVYFASWLGVATLVSSLIMARYFLIEKTVHIAR